MTTSQKHSISDKLAQRIKDLGLSQNTASRKIGNISPATVNALVNKKWLDQDSLISEEMWNNVASWLGDDQGWVIVSNDRNFKKVTRICRDCQSKSIARPIIALPGRGKSIGLQHYANSNPNVYYIQCAEFWSKKTFLNKLRQAMGLELHTGTVPEIMEEIIRHLNTITKPIIIIDEADKLQDKMILFFVSLYNEARRCGFVLAGSVFLEKRMDKGVKLNKMGYAEAFSRLGGEFYHLNDPDPAQVREICEANGINNDDMVREIINRCGGDLRRVNRMVEDFKMKINKAA